MRIVDIAIILRKDGFFQWKNQKIRAAYPQDGYAVFVFLGPSPIDSDFSTNIWVPSVADLHNIRRAFEISDELTHELLGRGWSGVRPFWKLQDFM